MIALADRMKLVSESITLAVSAKANALKKAGVDVVGVGDRADVLWQHTCFEAFVAPAGAPGYHEFNFSPSLDWAIYRFSAYREGMSPAEIGRSPEIAVRRDEHRRAGSCRIPAFTPGCRQARHSRRR